MLSRHVSPVAVAAILFGCSQGTPGTPADPGQDKIILTGDQKADWAQITAVEDEAKALVKPSGCSSIDQCRTAPVGSKACGGPRYYLLYCSVTTDSVALFRKLDAVAAAEREYNTRYKIASTCDFRMPPQVTLTGLTCHAQ